MSNFAQKQTQMTTFYLLGRREKEMIKRLEMASKWKKVVLVVPMLVTEFSQEENLPVFINIIRQLKEVSYVSRFIFGLDRATDEEARQLAAILKENGLKNYLIQHNEGAGFSSIYQKLSDAGFSMGEPGKGKNMFISFGIALALGASCVGVIDADIKTFRRSQLDRLFFPVVTLDYEFSKAFYSRISDGRMYGRVKRLLLDPLLISLKRKFTESKDEKMLKLIDFLLAFNYQLSGEVAFDTSLLKRIRFATNWGVELFTLIEIYRKANTVAQVQFSSTPFDHKHQEVSFGDRSKGLNRMAVDIVTTLLTALVIEEGLEISEHFMRDIAITYINVADDLIKKYTDNAAFSSLEYDRNEEEAIIRSVFKDAILYAGDLLTSPYRLTERFLRFLSTHEQFRKYLDAGLDKDILLVEEEIQDQLFETPSTVSWDRILMRLPKIMHEIVHVVENEKRLYG